MDKPTVGNLVRMRRKAMGLTVEQAASKAGLTRQGLTKVEQGQVGVSLSVAARLCDALVIDPFAMMRAAR